MTNTSNRSIKFLLLFLSLLSLHAAWGQEEGVSSWQLKGFVDTYHAARSEKPNDFMSSRTRVKGEIGKVLAVRRSLSRSMPPTMPC